MRETRAELTWQISNIADVLEALARQAKLHPVLKDIPPLPQMLRTAETEEISRWLDSAAGQLGLEIEPMSARYEEMENFLDTSAPVILLLPQEMNALAQERELMVIVKGGKRKVIVLCPRLGVRRVSANYLRSILCANIEEPIVASLEQLLLEAEVPKERRNIALKSILREQLASVNVVEGWLLRLSPGTAFWKLLLQAKITNYLVRMFSAFGVQQFLSIFAWWMIGMGVFQGRFEWVWLIAWGLVLITAIPFQIMMIEAQSLLSVHSGSLFKQRLLFGVLKLEPEEIRHQGAGQFLGRVMEASAVEALALSGGLSAVLSIFQILLAGWILAHGAGGLLHASVLFFWLLITLFLGWRMFTQSFQWVNTYREMTNDLVERMVGHRTRLAQENTSHWHDEEDPQLNRYISQTIQQSQVGLQMAFIPRGWTLIGLGGLALPMIVAPQAAQILAVSLGGVILASQAFQTLVTGINSIMGFFIALQQVKPLFQAASRPRDSKLFYLPAQNQSEEVEEEQKVILLGRDIHFRYTEHSRFVLNNLSLDIKRGERILLEGPSGGGKSTLAAVLAGLRRPESGLLLFHGFDQKTIGLEEWRRQIVAAPQFQENHIFNETFSFNLLMGRRWPPYPIDLQEAEEICRELGLGELLDRMPAGFQQMVGESGWQLSHGERSRLFIARALLQKAEVIILDESFGALDPQNLSLALRCVLNRAKTLIVIAHP